MSGILHNEILGNHDTCCRWMWILFNSTRMRLSNVSIEYPCAMVALWFCWDSLMESCGCIGLTVTLVAVGFVRTPKRIILLSSSRSWNYDKQKYSIFHRMILNSATTDMKLCARLLETVLHLLGVHIHTTTIIGTDRLQDTSMFSSTF